MTIAAAYPCERCGRWRSPAEVRPDPEFQLGPTVWRKRTCPDCGHSWFTAEYRVSKRDALRALARLKRERVVMARLAPERLRAGGSLSTKTAGGAVHAPATATG